MQISFTNVADFIGKRIGLLQEFKIVRERLETRLGKVAAFSDAELSDISNSDVVRYFMLKELLNNNQTFNYGVPDSHHIGEIKVFGEEPIQLDMRAFRPDKEGILKFLSEAYKHLPCQKKVWLIGERRLDERGQACDPEYIWNHPFDTGRIIEDAKMTDLLVLAGPEAIGPRANYDKSIYQRFLSPKGFGPVAEFCSRFPYQFFQAVILTPEGELRLEPERNRHSGWDVTHYSGNVKLQNSTGEGLVGLGKLADKYLAAA